MICSSCTEHNNVRILVHANSTSHSSPMPSSAEVPGNIRRRLRVLTTGNNISPASIVKQLHEEYPHVAPSRVVNAMTELNGGKPRVSKTTALKRIHGGGTTKGRPSQLDDEALARILESAKRSSEAGQPLTLKSAATMVSTTLFDCFSSLLVGPPLTFPSLFPC